MLRPFIFACTLLFLLLSPGMLTAAEENSVRSEYQSRVTKLDGRETSLFNLALWCQQNGLEAEAVTHLEALIALNPNHPRARKLLGYEKVKSDWLRGQELYRAKGYVEYRGRWMDPKQRTKLELRKNQIREMSRKRADWANAWELKTPNFIFTSNCPPSQVEEMARSMEKCYAQLAPIFRPRKHQPIPVEVTATAEQFVQLSFSEGIPVGPGTLGYFYWGGSKMGIRCYWAGSLDRTLGTLFHECTHLIIRNAYPGDIPIWSNEGMAVFFEFARITEKGLDIQSIPFDRLWHLTDQLKDNSVSLSGLVTMPQMGFTAEYYAQGWGLIHYLLYSNRGKLRARLQAFYELKQRKGDLTDFKTVFGQDPQGIFPDWKAYIDSLKPESTEDLMAAAVAALEYRGDEKQALAYADEAIAKSPTDWEPLACKARVILQQARLTNDPEGAQTALDLYTEALNKRPAPKRGKKFSLRDLEDDYRMGLAAIWAGDQERALAVADSMLEHDDFNADAYRLSALAMIAAPADKRDLDAAAEDLDVARDLGRGHETDYVQARLLIAKGDKRKAAELLQQAASQDRFGFGSAFYWRETLRLIGPPAGTTTRTIIISK